MLTRKLQGSLLSAVLLVASVPATAGLWIASRGKWGSAIVDSGREWIVPDCLARGELLYRDVVYWFGPLTPYLHALVFRVFGSTFRSLVLAGVVSSAVVLAVLFLALRRVTGRREAVLAGVLAVPFLLFMPNGGGAIFGMGYRIWHAAAFSLLAVSLAVRPSRSWMRAFGVGCLSGLAGLCRIEWGLAAVCGAAVAFLVRDRFGRRGFRDVLLAGSGFLLACGGVLAVFIGLAGRGAVLRDGHVLLGGLPPETRRFLLYLSGFHDPVGNLLRLLYSVALWAGLLLLIDVAAAWKEDPGRFRRRLPWLAGVALYLILYADYAGSIRMRLMGAAPVIGPVAVVLGLLRGGGPRSAALAAYGAMAMMLSYRRFFNIEDLPYVAPALLFGLVAALASLRELVVLQRTSATRIRLQRCFQFLLAGLIVVSFSDRIIGYAHDARVAVPGTEGMLSAPPDTARTLSTLSAAIRSRTGPTEGLAVFPEGEILNFLSRRPNPLRHKLYLPGYLSDENESDIVSELERARPAAIVILNRETPEYGRRFFGKNYGRRVWSWIEENYRPASFQPEGEGPASAALARLYLLQR